MVLKKIKKALEGGFFLGFNVIYNLTKITNIPESLIKDARDFMKRNSCAVVACNIENKEHIHECCPSCLEAHILKRANELGLNKERQEIKKLFECEIGHEGYYMDKGKLLEI